MEGLINTNETREEIVPTPERPETRQEKIVQAEKQVISFFNNRLALERVVAHIQDMPSFTAPAERS